MIARLIYNEEEKLVEVLNEAYLMYELYFFTIQLCFSGYINADLYHKDLENTYERIELYFESKADELFDMCELVYDGFKQLTDNDIKNNIKINVCFV